MDMMVTKYNQNNDNKEYIDVGEFDVPNRSRSESPYPNSSYANSPLNSQGSNFVPPPPRDYSREVMDTGAKHIGAVAAVSQQRKKEKGELDSPHDGMMDEEDESEKLLQDCFPYQFYT